MIIFSLSIISITFIKVPFLFFYSLIVPNDMGKRMAYSGQFSYKSSVSSGYSIQGCEVTLINNF